MAEITAWIDARLVTSSPPGLSVPAAVATPPG
jgi:hypothetical protein